VCVCVCVWVYDVVVRGCSALDALNQEYLETTALLAEGVTQLNEIAEVLVRLQGAHDKLSTQLLHENEKADLLYNILGSLLLEV
jgi:hypothetical protein